MMLFRPGNEDEYPGTLNKELLFAHLHTKPSPHRMKRTVTLSLLLLFLHVAAYSQAHKVFGKVVNKQMEPLAFASVEVRELKSGVITKEDGTFELQLEQGKYEIIISMVGYLPMMVAIMVDKDHEQNFILADDETKNLSEVVIKAKVKDRAEEIIRKLISNKENILAASGPYSCNVYIKATQQDSAYRIKKTNQPGKQNNPGQETEAELARMAMAEISVKLDYASAQQFKEERIGVNKRGEVANLFYLSATEGNFNLYNNLIKAPSISQIPFISPVSYSGLMAYRFKTIKIERTGKQKIYTISIKPRQLSNATVEGEITISDSLWAILHCRFSLPVFHLPEYDFFEVEQQYDYVDTTAWMITRQKFTYYSKYGKGKKSGETVAVFKDFELNKKFSKGYFGNAVSITAQEAYEKDSLFWNKTRTEPLTNKEIKFIHYKDSIFNVTHSKAYLDSLDAATNRITWKNALFLGQTFNNHERERRWLLPPLVSVFQPFNFGGSRINLSMFYSKNFPSKKNISVIANASYGIRNNDLNGSVSFQRRYNPLNGGTYSFRVGKDFQYIYEGDAYINMLKRSNIYLNTSLGVGHTLGIVDGLYLSNDFEIAFRRSVSGYETNPKADSLLGDLIINDKPIPFDPYNAVYSKINLEYTPKLRYIREPKEKIALGSKWPTFYVEWRKGVPGLFKSNVDFDYLEFGIKQKISIGTAGVSNYRIKTGRFFNQKDLRLVDYNFQRRGDPLLFSNPHKAFQALDSTFALFNRFYEGHYVHEFNGFLVNKIPLFKKLQLHEVAGAGFLIAPERNLRYVEMFAGMERIFKWPFNPLTKFKLGFYVVGSAANKLNNPVQFKIGISRWDWLRNRWL